jgi:UDP-N-acetylglucosamine 3-dehydrogenase
MLKAAVIGAGSMGRNHARLYRTIPGVRLVGVVDPIQQAAELVGTRENVPHYADLGMLLDEQKPDLVSIAAPTSMHYEIGTQVIERGLHVLMEKPITSNVEQGEALLDLAKRKGITLAVGHIERFNPAVTELRRRVSQGMAGRIYKIVAQRLSPYPSRISDAGVVIDLASHDIDLMRYLMPEPILRIYGETLHSINSDREDSFNGLIRFASGAVGVLDTNWMTPTKVRRLTVTGARGFLECDLLSQELFFYENDNAPSQWDTLSVLRGVSEGNILGIRIKRQEPLEAELTDFVSAVRDKRPPMVTGEEGLETLRLALQFVRSGSSGQPVRITSERTP